VSDSKKIYAAQEFKPSQPVAEPKKVEPVKIKEKEPHEKYFEVIAGSEEKANPFLSVFKEIQNKEKAPAKMDELLKKMVVLVSHCEFTPEQKSKNIIARLMESPEKIQKSLKEANSVTNDFQKRNSNRYKDKPREGGRY
jgi:hypothetical protein